MIRLGTTGLFICGSNERPRLNRSGAVALLKRCLTDQPTMLGLRALLGLASADSLTRLDDQQILEELAAKVEHGELLLFGEVVPAFSGGGGSNTASNVVRIPPRIATQTPAPQAPIQSDPSLFPPNTNLAAMADAIQAASRTGAPFCEH